MNPINKIQQLIKITLIVASLLMAPITAIAAEVVNINKADAATMIENWKGIGEKKARAIVAYRKKHGRFASIDDLANVKGMGEGLIKNNRKYMSITKGAIKPTGKSTAKKSSSSSDSKSKSKNSSKTTKSETTKKSSKPAKKDSSKKKSTAAKSKKKDCTAKSKSKDCKKKPTKKKKSEKTKKKKAKPTS